jgi:hypothetical protein
MGCARVLFGLIVLSIAMPLLIGFEALAAVGSALGNREAWYGLVSEPTFYEMFVDEVRIGLAQEGAAANLAVAALTPEYVQGQLRKTVDYGFAVAEGRPTDGLQIDIPAPLVPLLSDSGRLDSLNVERRADGSAVVNVQASPRDRETLSGLYRFFQIGVLVCGVLGVGFWLFSAIIGVNGVQGRLVWLGISLLLASLVVVGASTATASAVQNLAAAPPPVDMDSSARLERGLTLGFIDQSPVLVRAFWVAGGVPAVIGLVLCLLGVILRPAPARPTLGGGLSGRSGVIRAE